MLIAIDHGNKQMKTINCPPFVSGLVEGTTKPFGSDILMYLRSSSLYVLFPKCGNEAVNNVLQMPVLCGGEVRDF